MLPPHPHGYTCTSCEPHEYICTLCEPMSTPVLYVNPSDCIAVRDLEKHSMVTEYACILSEPHEYTCTICEPQ